MKKWQIFLILIITTIFMSCQTTNPDLIVDYKSYDSSSDNYFAADWLIREEGFLGSMESTVEPYLDKLMTSGMIECPDENIIHYEAFKQENDKGVVVLFHGFSEFTKKFNEQTYYFLKAGYSVVRFDHMGHGLSTRKVDNVSKVYTNEFDYYVEDANEVINQVAVPLADGKPLYLYAHSMGGGIGVNYIERYPSVFTKVVLNCPMLEINSGILSEMSSQVISRSMRVVGKGKSYIPGNRDYEYNADFMIDDGSYGPTVSFIRNNYYTIHRNENENYQSNGATYAWTDEAITATKKIRNKTEASKVTAPVLLFQAENDEWVKPKGQYTFRNNASTVKIAFYPEVEHEIYASHDQYLYIYYDMILKFFSE